MERRGWTAMLTACAAACVALTPGLPLGSIPLAVPAAPAVVGVPEPVAPRVAFTDEREEIEKIGIPRTDPKTWLEKSGPTVHRGELSSLYVSAMETRLSAFISTQDDPQGEVYVRRGTGEGSDIRRITCGNSAVESHPVISPDGTMLAYASDAKGSFDIWLVGLDTDGKECLDGRQLTTDEAADTWPTWAPGSASVIFSSTRKDPLGDLFQVGVPQEGAPGAVAELNLVQLTEGGDADTQPAAIPVNGPSAVWVIFTTTRFHKAGSLAALNIPDPVAGLPAVVDLWRAPAGTDLRQEPGHGSSEATWSSNGQYVAFTSVRNDPYGDIHAAPLISNREDGLPAINPADVIAVAAAPGVAESHAAWLTYFTGRGANFAKEGESVAEIAYTSRTPDADVSDAVAADGSARRTIAAGANDPDGIAPLDERGPAYSPDGVSLVWSREVSGEGWMGRELVRARADGSGAAPIGYERQDSDFDVDPVWSPDGNRIAFTRYRSSARGIEDPATWIIDLTAERDDGGRVPARRLSEVPPAGVRFAEDHPTWSPDGAFLGVSRRYAPDLKIEVDVPGPVVLGHDTTAVITISNAGQVPTEPVVAAILLPSGFVAAGLPEPCYGSEKTVFCPVVALSPGQTTSHKLALKAREKGSQEVVAAVDVSGDSDPSTDMAKASVEVVVSDLQLTMPDVSANFGAELSVTSSITNVGSGSSEPTTVIFRPSDGLVLGKKADTCTVVEREVRCDIKGLSVEDPLPLEITGTGLPGNYSVTAEIVQVPSETNLENNVKTAKISVIFAEGPGEARPAIAGTEAITVRLRGPGVGPVQSPSHMISFQPAFVAGPPRLEPFTSTPEIWVLDVATGKATSLAAPTPCAGTCTVPGRQPAWSPDGTQIAFSDDGALRAVKLNDADAAGGPDLPHAAALIVAVTGFDTAGAPTPGRAVLSIADEPAWSPDGAEIFFAGQPAGQPDQRGIYAIAPDGKSVRTVVQGRGPETEPAAQPWADLAIRLEAAPTGILSQQTSTLRAKAENTGPSPASSVTILVEVPAGLTVLSSPTPGCKVAGSAVICPVDGRLAKGGSATVEVLVRGETEGEHVSAATVTSATPDPLTADNQAKTGNQATAGITVGGLADVAVDLILDKTEGWTGGKPVTGNAKVTNNGPGPAVDVRLKVSVSGSLKLQPAAECPDSLCPLGALAAGSSRSVAVIVTMPPPDPAAARAAAPVTQAVEVTAEVRAVTADPTPGNNLDRAAFTVRQPTVRLFPAVARPGEVVTVVVEGLPAGTPVSLAWSKGIPPDKRRITAKDTELRRGLVLLRRDRLGERDIVVTSPDGDFGEIRAPMLVVARSVAPMPDFVGRG